MTQLLPMNSWKSIGPAVVSALKLGAMLPSRRLVGVSKSLRKLGKQLTVQIVQTWWIVFCKAVGEKKFNVEVRNQ